jgi:hypothetical protein
MRCFGWLSTLLLAGCIFETVAPEKVLPDLSTGTQWMYQFRQYLKYADGSHGDTTTHFIHYQSQGDTTIAGLTYRILIESDLAIFNNDYGLVKNQSSFAVISDDSGVTINLLKGGGPKSGRLPFKVGASTVFDSIHFEDEISTMKLPLEIGRGWTYREMGSPSGSGAARKTFLGTENIEVNGKIQAARKFEIVILGLEFIKTFEWYHKNLKVYSNSITSANAFDQDSLYWEEKFIGNRGFTFEDTSAILALAKKQLQIK